MRVFIYEYVCGGGLAGRPMPDSLAREGWAMLASVVEDFVRIDGCEVSVVLDERLANRPIHGAARIEVLRGSRTPANCADPRDSRDIERETIARRAAESDWTLVIAPEFDGVLLDCVRRVEQAGGRLLGPSSQGVAATADKFACARRLDAAGVPVVTGQIVQLDSLVSTRLPIEPPMVLKPRDGAGSQCTFLILDSASVDRVVREARAGGLRGEALLQPYVSGLAASVSLLIGPGGPRPLLAGEQLLSTDGRFQYLGGRMPLSRELCERANDLAQRAVAVIPGLCGYVGVDLVLSRDSAGDRVVEINPRLTTSYIGLRALARCNLAERMIAAVRGGLNGPIEWQSGTVGFSADGRLT